MNDDLSMAFKSHPFPSIRLQFASLPLNSEFCNVYERRSFHCRIRLLNSAHCSPLVFQHPKFDGLQCAGYYKYLKNPYEEKIVEEFLEKEGYKEEVSGVTNGSHTPEFGVMQDAGRLDPVVSGIAHCFTFGGSRNRVLHDSNIQPRSDLAKAQHMNKNEQITVNHFHEKIFKLKDLMKTKTGKNRAEKRHKFMEEFLNEFYQAKSLPKHNLCPPLKTVNL